MKTLEKPNKLSVTFRLDATQKERLDRLAEKTDRSMSFYLSKLVEDNLDELEELYLADQEFEDMLSGKIPLRTVEDVFEEMGIPFG